MPTLNVQVAAGGDDARWNESGADFWNGDSSFYICGWVNGTTGPYNSYARFDNVTIPQGYTIDVAYITLRANLARSATTANSIISAIDADDASAPANYAAAEGATRTTATLELNNIEAWLLDQDYTLGSLVAVIQEIINRPGWVSGNAIVLMCEDNGSTQAANTLRQGYAYNSSPTFAPKLHIEYSEPAAELVVTRDLAWSVRDAITATRAISYAIQENVYSDYSNTATATTEEERTELVVTRDLAWNTRQSLDVARPVLWSVRTVIETERVLSWGVRTVASTTRTLLWSIRVPIAVSRAYQRIYTVEIYPPLGREPRYRLDYDDINALVTALSWSSGVGGWAQALVGIAHPLANERYGAPLAHPHLKRTLRTKPFAHVEIKRNGRVVYAGRLGPLQRGLAGIVTGLSVPGYGVVATRDNTYSNTSATSVTVGTILKSIIANSAPHLRAASGDDWQDPGVSHTYSEFHRLTLADALAQAVSEGTAQGLQVDWYVYEGQRLALRTRQEPETPDYTLPFDQRVTGWVEDDTQMIGAVTYSRMISGVESDSLTFDTDEAFVEEHGFQRSEKLVLGSVTQAAALAIRKTYLRTHSRPVVSGALEFGPDDALEGPYGRTRPKDAARRGQWVQVGNEPMQMVMTTDYDATADVLRMEIGAYQPSFETLIAAFQQDRLRALRGLNAYGGKR